MFAEIFCISANGAEVLVAALWDLTAEGLSNDGLFSHIGKPEESRTASMLPHESSRGG